MSLILPVYNQGDHLVPIVDGYLEALQRLPQTTEIILVPNGCRDESPQRCRELEAEHPGVVVVELESSGWGRAVRAGLRQARGRLVAYTNSARTTPAMLTLMFAYAAAYPDVVLKANRKIRDSWVRRLGSLIYNLECRALFDLPTWDVNGTPKLFPRTFDRLLTLTSDGDLIDAEFALVCRGAEYPVIEVPILSTQRHGGKSTTNYGSAARMYWGAYQLARRTR